MPALESAGVCKSYLDAPVLRGLSFAVEEGESFGFAGVNGAGKSTFLKCMLNFCHYESGDISIFGVSSKKRQSRRADFVSAGTLHAALLPDRRGVFCG